MCLEEQQAAMSNQIDTKKCVLVVPEKLGQMSSQAITVSPRDTSKYPKDCYFYIQLTYIFCNINKSLNIIAEMDF
jgi:hypothetical protein